MANKNSHSLTSNIIFTSVRAAASMIFPLITFPYTSRILGPEGNGKLNFASSFVQYFIYLSSLGIPLYGTREIAKVRNNPAELRNVAQELFLLQFSASMLATLVYFVVVMMTPKMYSEFHLFAITSTSIALSSLSVGWLYQGQEDFRFITIRSLAFSVISIIALFIFVHQQSDYIISAIISVVAGFGSSVLNFRRAFPQLAGARTAPLNFRRHFRPLAQTFMMDAVINCYINLDNVMLGLISSTTAVGYYSAAMKLTKMVLNVMNSAAASFIPRMSNLIGEGRSEEYERILRKSFSIVLMLCIPSTTGLLLLRHEIIHLLAGARYANTAPCLAITAPVILMIGLSNIPAFQILYPRGRIDKVILSVSLGLATSLTLNLLLIPRLQAVGTAIASLAAETVVLIALAWIARDTVKQVFPVRRALIYISATCAMALVVVGLQFLLEPTIKTLFLKAGIGAITYLGILFAIREEFFLSVLNRLIPGKAR